MVIADGQVHHGANDDLPVYDHGSFLDLVHAEDGGLGNIDNGRGHQAAEDASVGNGESAPLHFVHAELVVAGLGGEFDHFLFDFGHAETFSVADHRHYQSLGCGHGNGDITVIMIDQFVAVDIGIDSGPFL